MRAELNSAMPCCRGRQACDRPTGSAPGTGTKRWRAQPHSARTKQNSKHFPSAGETSTNSPWNSTSNYASTACIERPVLQKFNEANRNLIVNINGKLVHRDEAGVSPFDSVVQGGDAVWEGLRLYNGRIFKLVEHLDRLRSSALALAFAQIPTHDEIIEQIRRTLAANQMRDGVHIRFTLTSGIKITSGM